jgi:hypothetical protein
LHHLSYAEILSIHLMVRLLLVLVDSFLIPRHMSFLKSYPELLQ